MFIDKFFVNSTLCAMIGLDALDNRILRLLGKKALHPSGIARELEVKRTTLTYRLSRLLKLGFVTISHEGRKSLYKLIFKRDGSKSHIQTYTGRDIVHAYRELFDVPKQSIILSVQGSEAVIGEFKNLPHSFIVEAHRTFKRKGVILKGFSNERSFRAFDKLKKPLIHSHLGRSLGIKLVPGDLFTCKGEVMVTNTVLLLANPSNKKVVLIKDKEIVRIVYDALTLLFELTEGIPSFDLNSYLQKTYF